MRNLLVLMVILILSGCVERVPASGSARFLAIGDSMFAVHGGVRKSVSDRLEATLGETIVDRSVVGAQYLYPLPISGSLGMRIGNQYVTAPWDWVIMNGGGNDLWLSCGCLACNRKLDRLISATGKSGAIPDAVRRARADGAKVLFVGYLRSPGVPSAIDHCATYGTVLEARLNKMAQHDAGITYLSLVDLVPHGDRSFHAPDMIHPSHKGSAAIAARIAAIIR